MLLSEKLYTRAAEARARLRLVPVLPQIMPYSSWTPSKYLSLHAKRRPNAPAIKYRDTQISWRELDGLVNRACAAMVKMGVIKGDKVILQMDNRPAFLVLLLALSRLQAVSVLLNTSITGKSLAHCINVAKGGLLLCGAEHLEKIAPALPLLEVLAADQVWIVADPDGEVLADEQLNSLGYSNFDALLDSGRGSPTARDFPPVKPSIMDICCYIYTSGTTGLPKAAIVTNQRMLGAGLFMNRMMFDLKSDETVYVTSPLYHSMGLNCGFGSTLTSGACLALRRGFSASEFWDDTRKFDASIFIYIGELCRYIANQPPTEDDRNHNIRAIGGVGLRPDVWKVFNERFGIPDVRELYGATEGSGGLYNITGKIGMLGRRQKGQAILRCDLATGEVQHNRSGRLEEIAEGETGLLVNFINLMAPYDGYVDEEASNKKLMKDVFKLGDCYFNTGDLVNLHEDGWLSFADRVGDTFRWKGENVSTNEVAEVLNACPGVLESNVYGVEVPGNEGKAGMASLNISDDFDITQLENLVAIELTSYQRPYFIRLQCEMRLTQTFKHQKVDYAREGFDPEGIEDNLYFLSGGNYLALDKPLFKRITAGEVDLR